MKKVGVICLVLGLSGCLIFEDPGTVSLDRDSGVPIVDMDAGIDGVDSQADEGVETEYVFTVRPKRLKITSDQEEQLLAVVRSTTGEVLDNPGVISWSASPDGIVEVDAAGGLVAVSPGEAVVTATWNEIQASSEISVLADNVSADVAIEIEPSEPILQAGKSLPVSATVTIDGLSQSNASVLWESTDRTIVAVDETGLFTGVAQGTTDVQVTSLGATVNVPVQVIQPAPPGDTTVAVLPTEIRQYGGGLGNGVEIRATVTGSQVVGVTWSTSRPDIFALTPSGNTVRVVSRADEGTGYVTATVGDSSASTFIDFYND